MGRRRVSLGGGLACVAAAWAAQVGLPSPALAQEPREEPTLDQLLESVQRPWLSFGALLITHVDAGLEEAPTSATIRAAWLRLGGTLDGGWSWYYQMNIASAPSILDARIGWAPSERLTLYAGRFKTPYSRELLTYLGDLDFMLRSRVVDALAPFRQIGVQARLTFGEHLRYTAGGFTGGSNQTPNEALVGVMRVEATALALAGGEVSLAAQMASGRDAAIAGKVYPSTFEGDGFLYGFDARYERGPLFLAGEYHRADWEPVGTPETDAEGWFATAGWTARPNSQIVARWDRWRAPGAEASDYIVGGLNVWPQSFAQLMLNWWVPFEDAEPQRFLAALEISF